MKRFSLFMIFCLLSLLLSFPSSAAEPAGEVAAVRGKVEASGPDHAKRPLSMKSPVFSGDVLVTGPKSRLQIVFKDNSIISMGPESEISISEYVLKEKGGVLKTKIKEGAFHIMGGTIAKETPDGFVTDTPVATIGIRGSMFALSVKDKKLSVVFLGGRGIDVFNSAGSVAITNPGFGTIVTDFKTVPESPRTFGSDELNSILEMAKPGDPGEDGSKDQKSNQKPGQAPGPGKTQGLQQPQQGETKPQGTVQPKPDGEVSEFQNIKPPGPMPPGSQPPGPVQPGLNPPVPGTVGVMNPVVFPQNTINNVINTNVENKLNVIVQEEQRIVTRGLHQSVWGIESGLTPGASGTDVGTVEAELLKGHVNGFIVNQQGMRSAFSFDLPNRDPAAPYSGFQKLVNVPSTRFINGLEEHPENMKIGYSSTGTFLIFGLEDFNFFREPNSFIYSDFGFTGVKALQERRFNQGISTFTGPALGFARYSDSALQTADDGFGDMKIMANWHNNKIFGLVANLKTSDQTSVTDSTQDKGAPILIMGDISPDRTVVENAVAIGYYLPFDEISLQNSVEINTQVILPDSGIIQPTDQAQPAGANNVSPIVWLQGGVTGEFYGSQFDGFGFRAEGDMVKIESDQSAFSGRFQLTSAGFRDPVFSQAKAGITVIKGFAFGIAEDMTMPDRDAKIFMNSNPEDFMMEINRDTGNIRGFLNAQDIKGSGAAITGLEIGGANMSAYVDDTHFGAITGGSNSMTSPNGTVSGLKPYGNYLITDLGGGRLAAYTSWGYWEASYTENRGEDTKPYHIHQPGSMWIAGEMTPEGKMNDLRQTGFQGVYEGKAMGVWYNDIGGYGGQAAANMEGVSRVDVDLSPGSVIPLKGQINFAEKDISLNFQSDRLIGSTFHSEITNAQSGKVNGAFFGPNAESVAGSFGAKLQDGSIMGVFGANRNQPQ